MGNVEAKAVETRRKGQVVFVRHSTCHHVLNKEHSTLAHGRIDIVWVQAVRCKNLAKNAVEALGEIYALVSVHSRRLTTLPRVEREGL